MSGIILTLAFGYAQLALALALCCALWRAVVGPRAQDRVLGLDTLYTNGMLLLMVTGMLFGTVYFFEAALVIAMLGFVSSLSFAKFLMRGEVIE